VVSPEGRVFGRPGNRQAMNRAYQFGLSQVMAVVEATGMGEGTRGMLSERASQYAFLGVSALVLAASAAGTIVWCASMSAMGEMSMPAVWTMSMVWMRMPGQTWPAAGAAFIGMWVVMMVAMMLPVPGPMLWRYRADGRQHRTRGAPVPLTALVGWWGTSSCGPYSEMIAFPLGVALRAAEMQQPALARAYRSLSVWSS